MLFCLAFPTHSWLRNPKCSMKINQMATLTEGFQERSLVINHNKEKSTMIIAPFRTKIDQGFPDATLDDRMGWLNIRPSHGMH